MRLKGCTESRALEVDCLKRGTQALDVKTHRRKIVNQVYFHGDHEVRSHLGIVRANITAVIRLKEEFL